MSWEEFKKKKQQKSSWQEFKNKKENNVQQTTKKQEVSLWQNIQNLAADTGRSIQNLFLGASSGVKQSFNYGLKTAESKYKTEQRAKNERVLGSKELSASDKAIYIAGTRQNYKKNTIQDVNLPVKSFAWHDKEKYDYDKEKVEEIANKNVLDKAIEKDQQKIQNNIDEQTNKATKKLAELAPSIGNMGVGAALSAVNPALGTAYFTTSAGGSYIQDAEERGMTREEAVTYGSIMGLMEGATEAIGWENLSKAGKGVKALIKGTSKEIVEEGVEQVAKNSLKTVLKDYGIGIADNVLQESLIEPIQEITAGAVAGNDKADWSDMGQRMLKAGIDGGLTSAIVGGANLGIESCIGIVEKTQNGQNVTQQELQSAVKDASKQLDVEKMIKDSTQQQVQKYNTSQENVQNKIIEEINPYRNIAKANKLVKEKNNKIRELEEQIKQTNSATIKNNLQEEINQIEGEYNSQIQELYDSTNEYSDSNQENAQNGVLEQTRKRNKINEKVNEYIKQTRDSFSTDINISTDVVNKNNESYINYKSQNQRTIYTKAKELFSGLHKRVFKNNNQNIYVTNADISESINKTIKNIQQKELIHENLAVFSQLDKIIENAEIISTDNYDNKGRTQYSDYEYYVSKANIDGQPYIVEFDTRLQEGTSGKPERHFRLERVYKINEAVPVTGTANAMSQFVPGTASVNNIIPQNTQNMQVKQENMPVSESNAAKYNRYKKNILKAQSTEVNNLIKNKNNTINEIEQKIAEKKQLLNNKKNKNTQTASNLKMQIENLKKQKAKIENEYNSRIDRKFGKATKDIINYATKKKMGTTRKEIHQNLLADTNILNESLDNAQNLTMLNINRTDPIRLQEKVFGKELGTKINEMFFRKVKHNTAEKTRFLNKERTDIKNWGIKARSFESEVLQKYTEKSYVNDKGVEIAYTNTDLEADIPNQEIRNKIKKASKELREKYDYYIDTANEVLIGLGYDAIPKRKDYVRHFTELNDIFTQFGIPGKFEDSIPTDINGITEQFRPGKNFFANAQRRYGNKTTYDAITGIDGYIDGISNLIYHTEDIQRLRAFDKYIRDIYGQHGFENLDNLSEEEKNTRIEKISQNHLSNYVSWLTEYTNNLAGKNAGIDRSIEKLAGRNIYSTLNTIKKQTGSNMTGFNIGSALTNFISVMQGASKTEKLALLKGTASTIQNIFANDGFVERSDFLTNRFGSDRISKKMWQKISDTGQVFMGATDYFTSNLIVRSKYYENLSKGMNETEALKSADDFGERILGDRSQGATANVFNSKMLGIVTQFQLEVNNQFDTMIHDTIQDFKTTAEERGTPKASLGAVWTLGQMAVYQYIFNNIFEAIAGRRPAFDIIDIIKTAFGLDDDENDEDTILDNLQQASRKLIESLPFINLLSEDARIPIASATPNLISVATGDSTLKDEISKLVYLLPPTAGSQAKKSIEGIKTVIDGGSYVTNSEGEKELRFPVENTSALDYIKAGVFGKYALPLAQEYIDRDYKRLSAKQTKTYEESNLPFKEYLKYIDAGLKTNEDKINYLESKEMNTEQKWGIYTNDLFSSTERKEDGGSQLSDAKYITSNGISKNEYIELYNKAQKNNIDMPTEDEYKEMKSNNISLSNYIDYKIKVKDLTESKRKSKELSDTENLKNADKIQILLDSNYSNKEISGIYANYIKSEKDTEYDIMKVTGIDIEEYLKYKQQEFTSDTTDDGTLSGKTVSKSKQKKVVSYLNSMNIKGNQRLLLYAMQGYALTASQKTQLANYVYRLDLDRDTKLKLYNKFSGFTAYKDGKVTWQ
ncbi:MAG: hypothetical protein IKL68_02190 [Clostridia bacterium]|nr:hypothetical protein [Clostridia bacterium]